MRISPIFIKIGGSILTDKTQPEALNLPALHTITATLAALLREQPDMRLLIGHGGGSFGHYWAQQFGTQHGVRNRQGWQGVARVADAMGRLNRVVVSALLEAGIDAIGVQPLASARAEGGTLRELETSVLARLLEAGVVPVIYGDVVLDSAQGAAIISTEELFTYLVPQLQPRQIVLLGEAGVFTADPRRDPGAVRIAQISAANIETVLEQTGASHGTDVTGGMAAKVRHMWQLVQSVAGLEVVLIGVEAAALRAALRGEEIGEGTVIRR
jgi:isopentenyl phosphate kinase